MPINDAPLIDLCPAHLAKAIKNLTINLPDLTPHGWSAVFNINSDTSCECCGEAITQEERCPNCYQCTDGCCDCYYCSECDRHMSDDERCSECSYCIDCCEACDYCETHNCHHTECSGCGDATDNDDVCDICNRCSDCSHDTGCIRSNEDEPEPSGTTSPSVSYSRPIWSTGSDEEGDTT